MGIYIWINNLFYVFLLIIFKFRGLFDKKKKRGGGNDYLLFVVFVWLRVS